MLIPVDSGSRVLEICLAFDKYWASSKKRGAYNLALLSPLHKSMLGIAQQNMNYMSLDIINQFTKDRINPFQFRYVRVVCLLVVCWLIVGCLCLCCVVC